MDAPEPVAAGEPREEEEGYRFVLPRRPLPGGTWLPSRCVVEVTPTSLRVREELGPLHWTWHHHWSADTLFQVANRGERGSGGPVLGLRAKDGDGESWFALGYPEAKLGELAERLRAAQVEWAGRRAGAATLPGFPVAGSKGAAIRVERSPGGLRIDVPPLGLGKGAPGLFRGGLALCAFTLLAAAMMLTRGGPPGADMAIAGLVLALFFAIGALLTVTGWNMATRRASVTLDEDDLRVTRHSIFGVDSKSFPRFSITNVARGPSGMVVNNKPIDELQIFVRGRKALGMMSQRSDEEIERVALALTEELSGPGITCESDSPPPRPPAP